MSTQQTRLITKCHKRPSKRASLVRFFLQVPWSDLLSPDSSCKFKLGTFTDIINLGLNMIMPERSIKVYETDRPWLSAQFKQLIARRHKALVCQNQVNRERKCCWKVYYENKVKSLHSSRPRDWWREVKQLCGSSKSTKRDLKSMLHQDLVCEGAVLAE